MTTEIQRFHNEQGRWADSVFGRNRQPHGSIEHLAEEVDELRAAPFDRLEYADCLSLLLDAYRNTGGSADDLVAAAFQKLEINRAREWCEPDERRIVRHKK